MSSETATREGPLTGIRVLDVSTILAGPLACQILGDYGADVIKIEHPVRGDGMRGHGPSKDGVPLWWAELSRNKRTMGLYLGDPEGADIFRELAATADVVVENFRPGTLERWGVGWEDLHRENSGLVMVRITGWGQSGPYSDRAGFGTLAEAMSGFAHLTGPADAPPTLPAFGLADSICGMAASSLATMALYQRDTGDGEGQQIDLSIIEPIMTAIGPGPTVFEQLGIDQIRSGNRSQNNAPRNLYQTMDGHWVAVSTSATSVAERVMELIGHPEVTTEPWFATGRGRVEHVDQLDEWVSEWMGHHTRDEVLAAFDEAGAAVAPVYSSADVVADEHFRQTGMVTTVEDEKLGPLSMHGVLGRFASTPGSIRFTGRPLGADTDDILSGELSKTSEEIARLREDGIVA